MRGGLSASVVRFRMTDEEIIIIAQKHNLDMGSIPSRRIFRDTHKHHIKRACLKVSERFTYCGEKERLSYYGRDILEFGKDIVEACKKI